MGWVFRVPALIGRVWVYLNGFGKDVKNLNRNPSAQNSVHTFTQATHMKNVYLKIQATPSLKYCEAIDAAADKYCERASASSKKKKKSTIFVVFFWKGR